MQNKKSDNQKSEIIKFSNVHFSYNSVQVLKDVSFTVFLHDFVSIVGTNGGGKTTLLKTNAKSIELNYPELFRIGLLVAERPLEFTECKRSINGEVIAARVDGVPVASLPGCRMRGERGSATASLDSDEGLHSFSALASGWMADRTETMEIWGLFTDEAQKCQLGRPAPRVPQWRRDS